MLPEQTPGTKETQQPAQQAQPGPEAHNRHTEVPNAHAAGVGAMGRNDEKLPSAGEEEEHRLEDGTAY